MQNFKLDHSLFHSSLNAHFVWAGANHCCPNDACTWPQGVYFTFHSLGLKRRQVNRIILEHLEPGYYVERMIPGRVSPANRFDGDPFIAITSYYNDQEYPFDRETNELLATIYSDPAHSAKFFKGFFDNWLPSHKKTMDQRENCRGFFTKILADNQRCFDLRDTLPDDR